jgi:hypothetical protein
MSKDGRPNETPAPPGETLPRRLGIVTPDALGTPEQPWIVSSAEKAASLPDGAWFAIAPVNGGERTSALVFQKTQALWSDKD